MNYITYCNEGSVGKVFLSDAGRISLTSAFAANYDLYSITRVIFNGPATIVFWEDGSKTVVKCKEGTHYDERTAIMWAIMKKNCGNNTRANRVMNKLINEAYR